MSILNSLSHGTKISITRSIKKAFEQYMADIMWNERAYDFSSFMKEWQRHIQHNASWYKEMPDSVKEDPAFHEELAVKINQVVEKIFSEEPTAEQVEELNALQKEHGTDYDFTYKAETQFYIRLLREQKKKKPDS